MKHIPTKDLVEELVRREGVKEVVVEPHKQFAIKTPTQKVKNEGPLRILMVFD